MKNSPLVLMTRHKICPLFSVAGGVMMQRRANDDAGPEVLGEILSRLFAARGWGRRQGRLRLESAWGEVAGPEIAAHTRVGTLRRGVLEVTVDQAVLLQELAHFHKRRLLEGLRARLPELTFTDLRFRAGVWKHKDEG